MINGDVTRFSTASTTPSGVHIPIAVEPNCLEEFINYFKLKTNFFFLLLLLRLRIQLEKVFPLVKMCLHHGHILILLKTFLYFFSLEMNKF
jgi:hypothetical protein